MAKTTVQARERKQDFFYLFNLESSALLPLHHLYIKQIMSLVHLGV